VSNTLTAVIPTLFARGLMSLRHLAVMPRLVMTDFGDEVRKKGEIIQIPLPSPIGVANVVPAAYAPDPGNLAPTTAQVPLDTWIEAPFALSEKELAQIVDGIVPIQLSAAIESIAARVNGDILANYISVPNIVGTPGTTPFATDVTAATNAGAALTNNLAPHSDRHIVLNPTAYGTALALPAFYGALYSGDTEMVKQGRIGYKFGFNWNEDQQIPSTVAGTITTGLAAQASTVQAVGLATIVGTTAASTGAAALKIGDIIAISGQTQTYTLTAAATQASAASNVSLAISPPLAVALAGGETITVKTSSVVNLAFHRQAFAFASRPLGRDNMTMDTDLSYQVSDPVSGISMRLTVREEFHRTRFAYDILYGTAPVRPLLACRICG
jgi:hypothetical protein